MTKLPFRVAAKKSAEDVAPTDAQKVAVARKSMQAHAREWYKKHSANSPASHGESHLPMEDWRVFLKLASETDIISLFDEQFSPLQHMEPAFAYLAAKGGATTPESYTIAHLAETSQIWELMAARAVEDATNENAEFTPLLDLLWTQVERTQGLGSNAAAAGGEMIGEFMATKTAAALGDNAEAKTLRLALQFNSSTWRKMVFRSSMAICEPHILAGYLKPTMMGWEVEALFENLHLKKNSHRLLQDHVIGSLARDGSRQALAQSIAEALERKGIGFTEEQKKYVENMLLLNDDENTMGNTACISALAADERVYAQLARAQNQITIGRAAACGARGKDWLAAALRLATAANSGDSKDFAATAMVIYMFQALRPHQVAGLTSGDMVDLIKHDKAEIRDGARQIAATLPAGEPTYTPAVVMKKRRR